MADLFNLLSNGQLVEKKEIVEGLNPPAEFDKRLKSFFPETLYNINSDSLLYKFLYSILGDSGVNGVKKALFAPKLFNALSTTHFDDLDYLFSNSFQLGRLNDEIYLYDPYNEMLTEDQWAEIKKKDSNYKSRSQDYMRGIQTAPSPEGLALLARSATGYECEIFENWQYLDDINSDEPIGYPNYGSTNSSQEFVIRPETESITPSQEKTLTGVINRLKPSNSFCTINLSTYALSKVPINAGTASSYNFYVQRSVTGNGPIDYSYNKKNNWISGGGVSKAPTAAFDQTSESITYLTVNDIYASTFHLGNFSTEQQNLFAHLDMPTNTYPYTAEQALSDTPDIYKIQSPWLARNSGKDSFIVNNHYPVGYFADSNFNLNKPSKLFWASEEALPDMQETLDIDFGSVRPLNNIQFEISQKPIDFSVYYLDQVTNEFEPVVYKTDTNNETSINYLAVGDYTWQNISLYTETIQTTRVRIVFTRRTDPFPNTNSPLFPWSIEIRNLKFAHIISTIDEFVENNGIDILGNSYSTSLKEYAPKRSYDGSINTYWQSQINPSRFGVEALYFDISNGTDPSFIDEIYLDPLTPECLMHIYWSNEGDPGVSADDWDNKLWTPIPRHYLLRRGNVKLYETVRARYIKLEFTKLVPLPYKVPNSPVDLEITYRTFPTWVESYVFETQTTYPNDPLNDTEIYKSIDPTPINIGLINPKMDKMTDETPRSIIDYIQTNRKSTVLGEYQVWKNPDTNQNNLPILDKTISMYPNVYSNLYQQDMLSTIKMDQMNSAYEYIRTNEDQAKWIPENPLMPQILTTVATKSDRTQIVEEKNWPDMWFMRKCRHAYKVIRAKRSVDVGYHVAIREIVFYKRDKAVKRDSPNYIETLLDDSTILKNTFYQKDWRWGIPPTTEIALGSSRVVEYASESFDGVAF
jgi:hypothetical protein